MLKRLTYTDRHEIAQHMGDKLYAFVSMHPNSVPRGDQDDQSLHGLAIIVANEKGFIQIPLSMCYATSAVEANQYAGELNRAMAVSRATCELILKSTGYRNGTGPKEAEPMTRLSSNAYWGKSK